MKEGLTVREKLMARILLLVARIISDNNFSYKEDIEDIIRELKGK